MKFPAKDADHPSAGPSKEDLSSLLQDCRIMRKDELQIIKGTSTPKVPDCFQRTPKRIPLAESAQVLAVSVDNESMWHFL